MDHEQDRPDITEISHTVQRARIPHHCRVCRSAIIPGQRYIRVLLRVDGDLEVEKYHMPECQR